MADIQEHKSSEAMINNAIEASIRIGIIALILIWVLRIVAPFVTPFVWAVIITVACYPPYEWLRKKLWGHDGLTATLFSVVGLALLVAPVIWLTAAAVRGAQSFATHLRDGTLAIPEPSPKVADWPLIGERVYDTWMLAHSNLAQALEPASEPLRAFGVWLLRAIASGGTGVLLLTLSIIIAAVLLAHAQAGAKFACRLTERLAPGAGDRFVNLIKTTIRGVATGVLGVAVIQTLLLTIGFIAAGIPGAAILSFICLVLCIVQLPPGIVVFPAIFYMFVSPDHSLLAAILFTVWMVPAGLSDNILKPIFLGRGSDAPMLVIFVGAIGGFMLSGIIGLFTGAVVMVVGYELFVSWIDESVTEPHSS